MRCRGGQELASDGEICLDPGVRSVVEWCGACLQFVCTLLGTGHGRPRGWGRRRPVWAACRTAPRLQSAWHPITTRRGARSQLEAEARREPMAARPFRLYEEGPPVNLRSVVRVNLLSWLGGLERRSCLYGLLVGGSGDIGCSLAGASPKGRSGRQTKSGASGSEGLVAGEHVPDRVGEAAGDVDLGHLGAALLSEPALVSLVALGVGGMP